MFDSCTNSSLMRITPLAVWAADIDDLLQHRDVIIAQNELTHSNPLVHDAAFVYSQVIRFLIKNADMADKAL